ncbi:MAG: hypothetical protein JSU60_04910 [Nitrospirota bacterium]|nr:MAG: hypothetical protein JSU60_04910 [Nitrospirota bacterium]
MPHKKKVTDEDYALTFDRFVDSDGNWAIEDAIRYSREMCSKKRNFGVEKNCILNHDLAMAFCSLIEAGMPINRCCELLHLSRHSYTGWLKRAKAGEEPFMSFVRMLAAADARKTARLLSGIERHGEKDWKALAWILERANREEFGKTKRVDVNHQVSGKVQVEAVARLPDNQRKDKNVRIIDVKSD